MDEWTDGQTDGQTGIDRKIVRQTLQLHMVSMYLSVSPGSNV